MYEFIAEDREGNRAVCQFTVRVFRYIEEAGRCTFCLSVIGAFCQMIKTAQQHANSLFSMLSDLTRPVVSTSGWRFGRSDSPFAFGGEPVSRFES